MGGLVRHYYFSKYLQKKGHTVKIFTSSKIHNTDINMIKDKSLYREEMEDGVEYTFVRSRDYKGNGIDRIVNMIDFPDVYKRQLLVSILKLYRIIYKYDQEKHIRQEREEAWEAGEKAGEYKGEEKKLKEQIRKKLARWKAIPEIAEALEEEENTIRNQLSC